MDALRDIEDHPAFVLFEDESLVRKRLKVLTLLHRIKCVLSEHGLTERVNLNSLEFSHYKECGSYQSDSGDVVDTCVCCLVGMYRYQALKILDEIHSESR